MAPTTEEEDADPEHKLPRITFSVQKAADAPGPLTIFLFDDEESSWHRYWGATIKNRSCDEIKSIAKATISNAVRIRLPPLALEHSGSPLAAHATGAGSQR